MILLLWLTAVVLLCAPNAWGDSSVDWPVLTEATDREPLPGTEMLDWQGDLAAQMVAGVDRFLLRQLESSQLKRSAHWQLESTSASEHAISSGQKRQRLAEMLGVSRDPRPEKPVLQYVDWTPVPRASTAEFTIHQVRWRAFGEVHGMGLLLEPRKTAIASVIAIPDAGQTPEELAAAPTKASQTNAYAFQLARTGCRVLVPLLIDRGEHPQHRMPMREWLHRPAYILGRTLAGYETQKILAAVDCLLALPGGAKQPVAMVGWGEGGRLGLYAAALDPRIAGACLSGYFGPRQQVWSEPADRTVFGLLREFGDAEIASLVAPRLLVIESSTYPSYGYRLDSDGQLETLDEYTNNRGKPGKLLIPTPVQVRDEFTRLSQLTGRGIHLVESEQPLADETLLDFVRQLAQRSPQQAEHDASLEQQLAAELEFSSTVIPDLEELITLRHSHQVTEIERHNQWALVDSSRVRSELFAGLRTDSLEAYQQSIEPYRSKFREGVIGSFDAPPLPANARTRKYQEGPETISYEVVLDVFPDVFAYGILTVPKSLDLVGNDRRPVVVCQHGLEGRPQDVVSEQGFSYYKAFATRLAERGFVTFAPQNIYIGYDRFRTLQFKAYSLGCTLYSIMVPQHEQITAWLAKLPFVDAERIAFYGLSYGGKSAMRIPALVDNYCLSICSGDFDDWIWKNAATDSKSLRYSYANKAEYEMYEFNLGGTFNYSEMAALICPRPFMVERGHFDGVAPDEAVAYEFAKVRHLYRAQLNLGERTAIEWFNGPHAINGKGTFAFLHKHLDWPAPKAAE